MRLILLLMITATAAAAAPRRAPVPASDLIIRQSAPALDWRWRIAPEAATQPALLAAVRAEALKQAAIDKAKAARDEAESTKAGIPFRKYDTIIDWSLSADTPRLLALAGETYAFTGGAHGNTGFGTVIWDKAAGRRIGFADLFSDWPRARRLLEPAYCAALAAEQTRRRGDTAPLANAPCPSLAEQPVVPWARLATTARQFRVLVAPYVAGSYAEGSYLIDVVWPDPVKALVKRQYRTDLFGPES